MGSAGKLTSPRMQSRCPHWPTNTHNLKLIAERWRLAKTKTTWDDGTDICFNMRNRNVCVGSHSEDIQKSENGKAVLVSTDRMNAEAKDGIGVFVAVINSRTSPKADPERPSEGSTGLEPGQKEIKEAQGIF